MILQISGELDIKEEDIGPARNPKWNYLITGTRISNLCCRLPRSTAWSANRRIAQSPESLMRLAVRSRCRMAPMTKRIFQVMCSLPAPCPPG